MSTTVGKILTNYLIQSYLLKRKIYYPSATRAFLGKLINFLEAATGCVL